MKFDFLQNFRACLRQFAFSGLSSDVAQRLENPGCMKTRPLQEIRYQKRAGEEGSRAPRARFGSHGRVAGGALSRPVAALAAGGEKPVGDALPDGFGSCVQGFRRRISQTRLLFTYLADAMIIMIVKEIVIM